MITTSGIAYSVYLSDPTGARLADASGFVRLNYVRTVNDYGTLTLTLPGTFDIRKIRVPDGIIEVYRRIPGTNREVLEMETFWIVQKATYQRDAAGLVSIVVEADTPLVLLREPGRIIYVVFGQQTGTFTGAADDVLKNIVDLHAGFLASILGRDYPDLTVAPDTSDAPTVTREAAWEGVLDVLQDVANDSTGQGTYLAFDLVATTVPALEFRTYIQQRGVDRRGQVILSPERGNLAETSLAIDYRDEATAAFVGGQGEGPARPIRAVSDANREHATPYRRREIFVDYNKTATPTILSGVGFAAVRAARPQIVFTGKIVDTDDTRYGVHWGWGDYLTAQDFGQSFDCRVDAISITVEATSDGPAETIEAYIRADDGSLVADEA